jgi:hypothetical protein
MVAKHKKKKLSAVLLDVEAAFDSVWHDALRYQMIQANLPGRVIKICSSYLRDRSVLVRVNAAFSQPFLLKAGVPQGGIVSPLLYLLYVSTMPAPKIPGVERSQFADDMAIWASAEGFGKLRKNLQCYLDEVHKWCGVQGIKINAGKSQAITFNCYKPREGCQDKRPQLHLGTVQIPNCYVVKFLGIKLDTNLRLNEHVKTRIDTCRAQVMCLSKIAKKTNLKSDTLKMLYRAYVESTMTYGAPILTILSPGNKSDLQKIQNIALRIFYGIPSYISTSYLHEHAQMPLVADRIDDLGTRWLFKACKAEIHELERRPDPIRINPGSRMPVLHHLWDILDRRIAAATAMPRGTGRTN